MPNNRLPGLIPSIHYYRSYSLHPLVYVLLLMVIFQIPSGCVTIDVPDTKPIDAYLTFKRIEFTAVDDDEVKIKLIYLCHNLNGFSRTPVTDRIENEFAEIAQRNKMDPPATFFDDATGQTLVVAEDFAQIGTFFDNVLFRFNNISKEFNIQFADAMLMARFRHDVENEKAEFHFSPFLFEPSATICFTANNGNLQYNIHQDSSTLRKHTFTDTYAEFRVESDPADSLFRARKSQLHFSFSKPPDPWYSWASIKEFFGAGDDDDGQPNKLVEPAKGDTNTSKNKPSSLREAWESTNTTLKWIAGVLLPILAFLGITRLWKKS